MKKGDKSGQFYLIAAMIIATIIIGFALLNNSSSNNLPTDLEELVEELNIEGEKVLDYDLVHSTNYFIDNFSRDYSIYAGEDKDIYFIIGEENSFQAYKYDGTEKTDLSENLIVDENILFQLNGISYEFKKEKGNNFYFLLTKTNEDENYVISG
jgi:hypothetical protein